jgi:hypothetical protein
MPGFSSTAVPRAADSAERSFPKTSGTPHSTTRTASLTLVQRKVVPVAMKLWNRFLPSSSTRHLTTSSDSSACTITNSSKADLKWKRKHSQHLLKVNKFLHSDQREIYSRIALPNGHRGSKYRQRRKQTKEYPLGFDTTDATNSTVEDASSSHWDEEHQLIVDHNEQEPLEAEAAEVPLVADDREMPRRNSTTRPPARLLLGRQGSWKLVPTDTAQLQAYLELKQLVTEHKHHIHAQRNTLRTLRVTSKALHRPMRRSFVQAQESARDYIMFSVIPEEQTHVDLDKVVEEEEDEEECMESAKEAESDLGVDVDEVEAATVEEEEEKKERDYDKDTTVEENETPVEQEEEKDGENDNAFAVVITSDCQFPIAAFTEKKHGRLQSQAANTQMILPSVTITFETH